MLNDTHDHTWKRSFTAIVLTSLLACTQWAWSADNPVRATSLRCEFMTNPVGIDAGKPSLSWQLISSRRGEKQTAYEVLVASSRDSLDEDVGDLWQSGRVESDQSVFVTYAGKPLESNMACYWKVRVWGKDGKPSAWSETGSWTMGLLKEDDWKAQWICAPEPILRGPGAVITKATYGTADGRVAVDVKQAAQKLAARNRPFKVGFKQLGFREDPATGKSKELVVEFIDNGKPGTIRVADGEMASVPTLVPRGTQFTFQLRKTFDLDARPSTAQITVQSPGYFELYVNGTKVGKDVLSPAVSDLKKMTFAIAYDVTPLLKQGQNCIGLWRGFGWTLDGAIRAQLDAEVSGKPVTIGTDNSWKVRRSELLKIGGWGWGDFGGERIDAHEILPQWSRPDLDDASWATAVSSHSRYRNYSAQPCPTNRIGKVIPAVAVTPLGNHRFEVDFGTNLTGWLRFELPTLESGTKVRLFFADSKKNPRSPKDEYQHFNQISEFISAGEKGEVFQHKFNYAGFRYVVVEGLPSEPPKESFTALLIESDLEDAGSFACSNELLNRIHEANRWTQRCLNLGGYYVDCPHRERLGYGDGQVAAEGFMSNFSAYRYYRKWLGDWRRAIGPNGKMPHTAPPRRSGGGPGWGGTLAALSWRHYLYYGDKQVLATSFGPVRSYVDYLETNCTDGILRNSGGRWSFIGDWVPPRRGMDTENWPDAKMAELFNNCYRLYQWDLLMKMAEALGRPKDVVRCRENIARIRPVIHREFYDSVNNRYVIDEQSYYVMPLMTGVTPEPEREGVLKNLEKNILVKNKGHLDTGMLGTYFMMEYLREIGRSDLIFTMFHETTYPGWGHMLKEDATTFWEQWNGYWSRIHSCFTSPDNWLYQGLAGIQTDPGAPGFKNVIIKPNVVGDVNWVKAHHESPYGRIVSNWQVEDGKLRMNVTVPANSTATVFVPSSHPGAVTESAVPADEAPGVTCRGHEAGCAVFGIGSGSYRFEAPL